MIKFVIAAAATALALPATALAQAPAHSAGQPLPDFPPHAQPGECWARAPLGAAPAAAPAHAPTGQSVWTLKRGHGPEAVWRYSERTTPGGYAPAPRSAAVDYQWTRVECDGSRPVFGGQMAQAAPVPPAPPLPPAPPHGSAAPHPHHPGAQPRAPHGHAGPMAPWPAQPPVHPHMPPPMYGHAMPAPPLAGPPPHGFGSPPHGFAPPPYVQHLPQPSAPWFGGRFLTWPGKT